MSFNPKVSIIIPVYNGSNYLRDAIDSAIAQTYKNIEIIIINDGSTDNGATERIAKSYGKKIRYFKKKNGGVATALNLGIKKMTGEYFSWLSHDDVYMPYKIKKQIKFLRKQKDKDIILYSDYKLIDENGKHLATSILDHEMLEDKPIYALLRGSVNGITMLIPHSCLEKYGDFDETLRCTQDYDMWYKMLQNHRFVHQKVFLAKTRLHSLQDTVANPKTIDECNRLWIRMIEGLSDVEKIKLESSLSEFYAAMIRFLRNTQYDGAIEYCQLKLEDSVDSENIEVSDLSDLLDENWKKKEGTIQAEQEHRSIPYRVLRKIHREGILGFLTACFRQIIK